MKRYIQELLDEVLLEFQKRGEIENIPKYEISVPKENFGDFTTNLALSIAREGKFKAPEIAQRIVEELRERDGGTTLGEINAVNGFINIFIDQKRLGSLVLNLTQKVEIEPIGQKADGTKTKVVFEYSSPNTNKPLHIGHTRNDVYGMACINLLRATGHEVIAAEIINDRGIHIMKSMLMYMKYGMPLTPQSEGIKPDHFVGKFYTMFGAESEEKKLTLEAEAQDLLRKWEAGDSEVRALWKTMNDWFFEGVKQTYKLEGSEFDEVDYESQIYDKGRDLVLIGVDRGVFQKEEDGSVSVDLTGQGLDKKTLLRKDGTTIYITQDLYLWHLRDEKFHPDRAIVTTSSEQAYHFKVLKNLFELLNFPWASGFEHLPYEHVYLGKNKMSSRAGNAVTADDLLANTKEKVRETIAASKKVKVSAEDDQAVTDIAFGAIKYGYLKYDRNTKIYFDLDETIAIEGNTGPYLQYTYARIKSVLSKIPLIVPEPDPGLSLLVEKTEQAVMRHLMHYPDTVIMATKEFKPNLICSYLFELASKFNALYDQVPIATADDEQLRVERAALLKSVAAVLEHGLGLLGIKAVDKI